MPVYEYRCEATGEVIEEFFPMTDFPTELKKDDKVYKKIIGSTQALIVPSGWIKPHNQLKFNRGPSGRRHFY